MDDPAYFAVGADGAVRPCRGVDLRGSVRDRYRPLHMVFHFDWVESVLAGGAGSTNSTLPHEVREMVASKPVILVRG
jgi:hypothetical protein